MVKKLRKKARSARKLFTLRRDPDLIREVRNLAESERSLELALAKEIRLLSKEIQKMKKMEVSKNG